MYFNVDWCLINHVCVWKKYIIVQSDKLIGQKTIWKKKKHFNQLIWLIYRISQWESKKQWNWCTLEGNEVWVGSEFRSSSAAICSTSSVDLLLGPFSSPPPSFPFIEKHIIPSKRLLILHSCTLFLHKKHSSPGLTRSITEYLSLHLPPGANWRGRKLGLKKQELGRVPMDAPIPPKRTTTKTYESARREIGGVGSAHWMTNSRDLGVPNC